MFATKSQDAKKNKELNDYSYIFSETLGLGVLVAIIVFNADLKSQIQR